MTPEKMCILDEDKVCTGCGECEHCELDPEKICDNCMRCLGLEDGDYRSIAISGIKLTEEEDAD